MTSILEIQTGLQGALDTITSLAGRTYAFWPESITPPSAWVWLPTIDRYHYASGRGTIEYTFPVYVAVGSQIDREAQSRIAGYAAATGADSVLTALEADQTLGGLTLAVNGVTVIDFHPEVIEDQQTARFLAGLWTVRVLAPGV